MYQRYDKVVVVIHRVFLTLSPTFLKHTYSQLLKCIAKIPLIYTCQHLCSSITFCLSITLSWNFTTFRITTYYVHFVSRNQDNYDLSLLHILIGHISTPLQITEQRIVLFITANLPSSA